MIKSKWFFLAAVVCYILAAYLYPNFTMNQTFWSDLMSAQNPKDLSRILSISALYFACLGTQQVFWNLGKLWNKNFALKTVGALSLICASFIWTPYHDFFVFIACLIGIIPCFTIGLQMIKMKLPFVLPLGILVGILLLLNNLLYYGDIGPNLQPIVQKITFLLGFIWLILLDQKTSTFTTTKGQ